MLPRTRLFVGNLPENTNQNDLQLAFSSYGEITNLDLKSKPADENTKKNFAFITLSASYQDLEQCMKHFSSHDFKGQRLYVTRARESFLERLKRERDQTQNSKETNTTEDDLPKEDPVIKLSEKLNLHKRKIENPMNQLHTKTKHNVKKIYKIIPESAPGDGEQNPKFEATQKKQDSDKKRMESLKKKRQEFKEKQMIIKTGLIGIDKVQNKKLIFSDDDDSPKPEITKKNINDNVKQNSSTSKHKKTKNALFEENDDSSGDEVTFEIKKQFEGMKGQKVLDLQSRYKSDKRFTLDERFINESQDEKDQNESLIDDDEQVEMGQVDEKAKQLNILQNVLGVAIRSSITDPTHNRKYKPKMGMLRFDPSQPKHAKFLAPVEDKRDPKKSKKKKLIEKEEEIKPEEHKVPKVEVSKEQFYKVSDTLKEAIAQPTTFSLRSLFGNNEEETKKDEIEQDMGFIPLSTPKDRKKKVRNPMEPGEKNPFVYDSSDSETEDRERNAKIEETKPVTTEVKAVWKENLFFTTADYRFKEGLAFFNKPNDEAYKERRELKSLMKKRIYNKDRKNQMFQKKIGGRKKTVKKSYRKKN